MRVLNTIIMDLLTMTRRCTAWLAALPLLLSSVSHAYDLTYEDFDEETLAVLKQAETSKDAQLLFQASEILIDESMMQENVDQGLLYLKQSADLDNLEALSTLAEHHYHEEEYQQALPLYQKLAEKGDAIALYYLGVMYFDGEGVEQDQKKGNEYYLASAQKGDEDAMFQLAFSYNDGLGIEQDFKQANHWFASAAEKGHALATFNLGVSYLQGEGVARDCQKAITLFEHAIELDDESKAYQIMGAIYSEPRYMRICGIKSADYKKALEYFQYAAEWGEEHSQFMIGSFHFKGRGVERNYVKALAWYNIAYDNGYDEAEKAIKEVKGKMNEKEIAKASEYQEALEETL
ncbi:sel1 repeat family protein [Vibrio vulnificus]|nr:sel1 repeat family protein [Vibrio vulnificus]POC28173.1 sel1 repeat family protein [Vibrio vulnificus]POC49999.1 sel1 repeat family protein [Vibrio vulnificus]RZQ91996.1 sel1 repeat family protein [Vibrio vulnificus]HAS8393078.1 sel1 repeat family protein [Vibrio vulnificus]